MTYEAWNAGRLPEGARVVQTADSAAWVCPWGICNHDQAQECRSIMRPRAGCGGRFPAGTTLEEAKRMIGPLPNPPA